MSGFTVILLAILGVVAAWLVWPGVASALSGRSQPATTRLPEASDDLAEVLFNDWAQRG